MNQMIIIPECSVTSIPQPQVRSHKSERPPQRSS